MAGGPALAPPRPERVPDLFEPVLGYRFWRVNSGGGLRCLRGREIWSPGVNRAICWRRPHEAPGRLCDCGFNALHVVPAGDRDGYHNVVIGAIAAWGEVEVHRHGFRAQFASVTALAEGGVRHPAARRRLLRAAEGYGVPLVTLESLPAEARLHACPVDPSVLRGRRAQLA